MIELAGIPIWIWGAFLAFVLAMLALDLGVFHRKAHEVKIREALTWSAVWIGLAMLFNLGIYFLWDSIYPASEYTNKEAGLAFLAGYLLAAWNGLDDVVAYYANSFVCVPEEPGHAIAWSEYGGARYPKAFNQSAGFSSNFRLASDSVSPAYSSFFPFR